MSSTKFSPQQYAEVCAMVLALTRVAKERGSSVRMDVPTMTAFFEMLAGRTDWGDNHGSV